MPELIREKDGEIIHSKKEMIEKLKEENPGIDEKQVEEKIVKESFRVRS